MMASPKSLSLEESSTIHDMHSDKNKDLALAYLGQHSHDDGTNVTTTPESLKALRHRVDVRMMPFLCLVYTLNFLDKVILNYAQVMGMATALELKGNNYSNASSAFWFAVLAASIPTIWLLNKLPVAKWLSVCLVAWGITTACHAALGNYTGLLIVRIFSGMFESGVPPALMLLSSQYYTCPEQVLRFAYWYMGMGWGQITGSLISFGFQYVPVSSAIAGWRVMFLVLGLVTSSIGVFVWVAVPDSVMQAEFLTHAERIALLHHVKVNQTGIENKHFNLKQIREAMTDIQIWAIVLITILMTTGAGVITAYSAILLRSWGFSAKASALLNIPSGVINVVTTLCYASFVRFYNERWLISVVAGSVAWSGAALLYFLPNSNHAGLLVGLYLINVLPGVSNINFQWLTGNTAGVTKRTFATAMTNAAFAVGNIIGPQTFRAKEAPHYNSAKLTLVVLWALFIGIAVLLSRYYKYENKRRDKRTKEVNDDVADSVAFAGYTDKENQTFRYQL